MAHVAPERIVGKETSTSRGGRLGPMYLILLSLAEHRLDSIPNCLYNRFTIRQGKSSFPVQRMSIKKRHLRATARGAGRIQAKALITALARDTTITPFRIESLATKSTSRTVRHCDGRIQADLQGNKTGDFGVARTWTIGRTAEEESLIR